ncbi:DUF6056 family protein [Eubacterium sp.]
MNNLIKRMKDKPLVFAYLLIFIALSVLCYLFPYTGDDWAWGSALGLERLSTWFDNYSGRYFGNLIVLALTRSNILKTFVMSGTITGIIVLINKITKEQKGAVWIITLLLAFMPVGVLKQSIVWTSGFSNYSTSIFLILVYIYYSRSIFENEKPHYAFWHIIPISLLGFASALIVEHVTIYSVLLAIFVIIYSFIKFKKVHISFVSYFVGTIAGTALMFSNSVYHSVVEGNDEYRTIGGEGGILSIVKNALNAYFDVIALQGFFENFVLNIILAMVCAVVWHCMKNKISSKLATLGKISLVVIFMYAGFSLMYGVGRLVPDRRYKLLQGVATLVFILAMFVFLLVLSLEKNKKMKILFLFFSTGCLIAPLFVVKPIGYRCFFAAYVVMILLILELYSNVDEDVKARISDYSKTALVVSVVGLMYLLYVYSSIYVSNVHRVEKAQADSETKTVIEVRKLPYSDYVWCSDLQDDIWKDRFKAFNGIDEDVKIKVVERKQ